MTSINVRTQGRRTPRLRTLLLGAVAIAAIGGVAAETTLLGATTSNAAQIAAEPALPRSPPGPLPTSWHGSARPSCPSR